MKSGGGGAQFSICRLNIGTITGMGWKSVQNWSADQHKMTEVRGFRGKNMGYTKELESYQYHNGFFGVDIVGIC